MIPKIDLKYFLSKFFKKVYIYTQMVNGATTSISNDKIHLASSLPVWEVLLHVTYSLNKFILSPSSVPDVVLGA